MYDVVYICNTYTSYEAYWHRHLAKEVRSLVYYTHGEAPKVEKVLATPPYKNSLFLGKGFVPQLKCCLYLLILVLFNAPKLVVFRPLNSFDGRFGLLLAIISGTPFALHIVDWQGDFEFRLRHRSFLTAHLRRILLRFVGRLAKRILVMGAQGTRYWRSNGIDVRKIVIIPHLVDREFWQKQAGAPFGTIEAICALAEPFGLKVRLHWHVKFRVSADAKRFAEKVIQGKRPYMIVHSGAGVPYKCWSPENFALVARKAGRKTVVVYGSGERTIAENVSALAGDLRIVEPRSVEELVALLERADLFIGDDAGPSHIAVACGVPTVVALMQKGKKEVWGYKLQYYFGVEVFRMSDETAVEAVAEACAKLMKEVV